jgi:hypothetical protein
MKLKKQSNGLGTDIQSQTGKSVIYTSLSILLLKKITKNTASYK